MKNALISVALMSLTTPAMAADTTFLGNGDYSWSGLYAGIHFAYAVGSSDVFVAGTPATEVSVDPDGFLGGIQVGVNYQMDSPFVIGAEADISYATLEGLAFVDGTTIILESSADWSGSARVRVGYALDRTLPYLSAGLAAAQYELTNVSPQSGASAKIHTETHIGWTVGAGVEHAFTDQWSARLDYRYSNFGGEALSALAGIDTSVDLATHDIRVGLNYRF